ncbi:hypothetical protein NI17_020545 [Thermobifida halotolerans]|uniref:Uncharacterized protein n=1 Tax=Thermobifida halotolerans TaxID=483545 RepID=A0AA97M3F9_9ACTN|nr:hypothetical protein [Thermobifida halotolerans]UOE19118.1 hypothetical protein NI17_020545 [Thermobifida halotolerans]
MTGGLVERLAERIRNIDWTERPGYRPSQVNLMREYLRRSARWSEETGSLWPFDDFARRIDFDVRADQKIVEEMQESLPTLVFPMVVRTCSWALHFEALRDAEIQIPDLPDPFEPLLLMYERGNSFSMEGTGYVEVGTTAIPKWSKDEYLSSEPFTHMDREQLDAVDN